MVDAAVTNALRQLREPPYRHAGHLVVAHEGEVIAKHQLGGRGLDEPADVFSVTKSVLATAVLLAVQDGLVPLDAEIGELLGNRVPAPRRAARVRHLLAMTGGAYCGGLEDIDQVMELPTSWIDALLSVAQQHPPGRVWSYDNGAAHLLAAAVHETVGDLAKLAAERIFDPLGIRAEWPRDPEGVPWGFGGLRLSALDLARLGEAWRTDALGLGHLLKQATTAQSAGGPPENLPYGWLFWICEIARRPAYLAAGWAGQHVLVVPDAALTVVVTGEPQHLDAASASTLPTIHHLAAALTTA